MDDIAETRSERVDLRMTATARRILSQAAATANKTLTEFLLDSGLNAAFAMLADRRSFVLDDAAWVAFMAALNAPPADNPRLRALMQLRAPWESSAADG